MAGFGGDLRVLGLLKCEGVKLSVGEATLSEVNT